MSQGMQVRSRYHSRVALIIVVVIQFTAVSYEEENGGKVGILNPDVAIHLPCFVDPLRLPS
jgi:hypothetical protein